MKVKETRNNRIIKLELIRTSPFSHEDQNKASQQSASIDEIS